MRRFFDPSHRSAYRQTKALLWIALLANVAMIEGCDMLASSIYVQNAMSPEVVAASSLYASAILDSTAVEAEENSTGESAAANSETSSATSEISLTVEAKIVTLEGEKVEVEEATVSIFAADASILTEGVALSFNEASGFYTNDQTISLEAETSGTITLYFTYGAESYETTKSLNLTDSSLQSVTFTVYMTALENAEDDTDDCTDIPSQAVTTEYIVTSMNERELIFSLVNENTSEEVQSADYTISVDSYIDGVWVETTLLSGFSFEFSLEEGTQTYLQSVSLTHDTNPCYDLSFEVSEEFTYRDFGVATDENELEIEFTLGLTLTSSTITHETALLTLQLETLNYNDTPIDDSLLDVGLAYTGSVAHHDGSTDTIETAIESAWISIFSDMDENQLITLQVVVNEGTQLLDLTVELTATPIYSGEELSISLDTSLSFEIDEIEFSLSCQNIASESIQNQSVDILLVEADGRSELIETSTTSLSGIMSITLPVYRILDAWDNQAEFIFVYFQAASGGGFSFFVMTLSDILGENSEQSREDYIENNRSSTVRLTARFVER